jgi:hypothetical protein
MTLGISTKGWAYRAVGTREHESAPNVAGEEAGNNVRQLGEELPRFETAVAEIGEIGGASL